MCNLCVVCVGGMCCMCIYVDICVFLLVGCVVCVLCRMRTLMGNDLFLFCFVLVLVFGFVFNRSTVCLG